MFKKISRKGFKEDLRKIGVTWVIGGLAGMFLRPHEEMAPLVIMVSMGWAFGI